MTDSAMDTQPLFDKTPQTSTRAINDPDAPRKAPKHGSQQLRSVWPSKPRSRGKSLDEHARPRPEPITIDAAGDLTLLVGTASSPRGQKRLLVSSHALRRVSPVWRAMLSPSGGWWQLKSAAAAKQLTLANDNNNDDDDDDDVEALVVVLNVAHVRFRDLPSVLGFRQLVQLARVCGGYETVAAVRPFLPDWTKPFEHAVLQPGYEEWLYVAWTFGFAQAFAAIARHLILHATVDDEGRCVNPAGKLLDGQFPPGILNNILEVRYKVICSILRRCYSLVDAMIEGNTCRFSAMSSPSQSTAEWERADEASKCTHLMHGSMVRQLKLLDLWPPLPNASTIRQSVFQFANNLKNLQIITWARPRASWTVEEDMEHDRCSVGKVLARQIEVILENMPSAVSQEHISHMKVQASK